MPSTYIIESAKRIEGGFLSSDGLLGPPTVLLKFRGEPILLTPTQVHLNKKHFKLIQTGEITLRTITPGYDILTLLSGSTIEISTRRGAKRVTFTRL